MILITCYDSHGGVRIWNINYFNDANETSSTVHRFKLWGRITDRANKNHDTKDVAAYCILLWTQSLRLVQKILCPYRCTMGKSDANGPVSQPQRVACCILGGPSGGCNTINKTECGFLMGDPHQWVRGLPIICPVLRRFFHRHIYHDYHVTPRALLQSCCKLQTWSKAYHCIWPAVFSFFLLTVDV